jgi:hypothetical protein
MKPMELKAGQDSEPARAGIRVRTQLKVGPYNSLEPCEYCKENCDNKPLEIIEICKQDCQREVCDN